MQLVVILCLGAIVPGGWGQTPPQTKTPQAERPLAERQQDLQKRIAGLEQRMQRLAKLLAEDEPAKAEKLRDAIEQTRAKRIDRRLNELVTLLKSLQYGDAERQQESVRGDLEQVLKILTQTLGDLDLKRQRRERMAAVRRRLRTLIQEQSENLFRTRGLKADAERAAALEKMASKLEEIERAQLKLRKSTEQDEAAKPERRGEQQTLEDRTRSAAEQLRKMAEPQPEKPAESSQQSETQAAEEAGKAAESMQKAGRQMEASQSDAAQKSQEAAEEQLRRAVRRLRKERDRLRQKDLERQIEEKQRGLEQKAGELQKQMQQGRNDSDRVPGRKNVGKARQQMQRAADRMGEKAPAQSEQAQQAAVDELQQALDRLEQALRQMRREEMEETLAALEVRFKRMLAAEREIQTAVVELNATDPRQWRRKEQMRLSESAKRQNEVVESCQTVQRIIVQEGTTVIFPEIVKQLVEDMQDIAKRLDVGDVAENTQGALTEVIKVLEEIVGAIEVKRDDMQNREQNGQPQQAGQQPQPLLPGSAELKLLRSRQIGLNRRTLALDDPEHTPPKDRKAAIFERLTARQRQLSELARRMNERK